MPMVLVLISVGFLVDLSIPQALPKLWAEADINHTTIGRILFEIPTLSCATVLPLVFWLNEFVGIRVTIWLGAVARLAALATWVLAETVGVAELGWALSGISQATKVPFYCHIFRLLTKELHQSLFGLLCIWTLLGNDVSNIALHFSVHILSADLELQIHTYFSIVPTIAACLLVALFVPFGNGLSSPFLAIWPGHNHPGHGSLCTRPHRTRLASDIRSWIRTMMRTWTIWSAILGAVLYGLQANLAYFLAQSVHPSHAYGLVYTIAAVLSATITLAPHLYQPVEHYPFWSLAIIPLTIAVLCEILSDIHVDNADTCLMYISYACITYSTSTIILLCIAAKINNDVFRLLFGLVMFVSLALQFGAEIAQSGRLIDVDGLLYIYLVAQVFLGVGAITIRCLTGYILLEPAAREEESPV